MSPESDKPTTPDEAIHQLRSRPKSLSEGMRHWAQADLTDRDTYLRLVNRFWRINTITKEDGSKDFDATWQSLKRRRFELEVMFTPQIADLFLGKMVGSETGLYHSSTDQYDNLELRRAIPAEELDKASDNQIGPLLAEHSSSLWIWALQNWNNQQQEKIINGGLQNKNMDTLGFVSLIRMTEYFNDHLDQLREAGNREAQYRKNLQPWTLFRNGVIDGNRQIWKFFDMISRKFPDLPKVEIEKIAQASYPTLAFLATFHERIAEPLTGHLSEMKGAWQMDPDKFAVIERRGQHQVVISDETWQSFLARFATPEELAGDGSMYYALPTFTETSNGELLGCPFFQAPGQHQVTVASGEAPQQFVTPLAVHRTYLDLASRFIFSRHHA